MIFHYKVCHLLSYQLFKKPHPPKRVRSRLNGDNAGISVLPGSTSDKIFFHHLDNLRPSLTPVKGKIMRNKRLICDLMGLFNNPSLTITNLLFDNSIICLISAIDFVLNY